MKRIIRLCLRKLKKDGAKSVLQIGSSLRQEEFLKNSDLDLLAI